MLALIAVLGTAQGMQTAALRALGVAGVASTAATGVWVSLFAGLSAWLRLPRAAGGAAATARARPAGVELPAVVLVVYLVGAAAAGLAESRWLLAAAALPTAAVAFVVVTAFLRFRPAPPLAAAMHS